MPVPVELKTERLLLRSWRDADRAPFAALNADPEVMKYFPAPLTRAQSDAMVDAIMYNFEQRGWGLWAVEVTGEVPFIGFVGLNVPNFDAGFTPCIEVGWRLAQPYWGHGYASEAARVAVQFGFAGPELDEILSWTATVNLPSRAVMERLGMTRDPAEDFDHPRVESGHWLRPHVLYRLPRAAVST
jgi:RimJ/RimL family protein N-acetyltransferase